MKSRRYVSAIILVFTALLVGWVVFRLTHPISIATLQLHVTQLPADDTAFGQWLSSQPLLTQTSVNRNNGTLTVVYKMHGEDAGGYASKIIEACRQMGYQVNGYSITSKSNPFQE